MTIDSPSATEPDLDRDIHFAMRPGPVRDPYHERNHLQEQGVGGGGGVIRYYLLGIAMVVVLNPWVGTGLTGGQTLAIVVVLLTGGCAHHVLRQRRSKSIATASNLPEYSNVRYRLRAIGRPERLVALEPLVAKRPEHFEPVIVRVARAREGTGRTLAKMLIMWGVLVGALYVGLFIASMFRTGPAAQTVLWWSFVFSAGAIGPLVFLLFWPTYVRIVPERLDVLRYSFLGRRAVETRSIDLRRAKVLVRAPRHALVILPGDDRGEWFCASGICGTREGEFEAAILNAARSDEPSPPLPDGELIG